ncbi:MAG TPA: DUF4625 domain-containing protein [Faecalibacter sp.]|uniref:DUF4625 domain-containing protein n=1 Tax=Faecalibacter sp. LW9 TaxID=3103144 RepID=UPI002AFE18DC|nr:DUF4625 domain-containing protein [Faecalibacter sp. LW9]
MKKLFKTTLFAASSLFLLTACSDDDAVLDTTKPTITLAKPSDHQAFEFGDVIELQAILNDDTELGSYKIDIHSAGDGHQHRSAQASTAEGWSYSDIADISGKKEHLLNKSIPIPTGEYAEGHYHLGLIVVDKAGNESQTFIEIVIGEDHHH